VPRCQDNLQYVLQVFFARHWDRSFQVQGIFPQHNQFVDLNKYEVNPNTIFFINKNQVHYFDNSKNYEGVLLHFNESFLVQHENDIDIFLNYDIFNNQHHQPFCIISKPTSDLLNTLISQISNELNKENTFGHKELLRHFLKSFLIQIEGKKEKTKTLLW